MMQRWHVFEFMMKDVYCATPATTLQELTRNLVQRQITGAPVVDEDRVLLGVVSLVDVAVACQFESEQNATLVKHIMKSPVLTMDLEATLPTAVQRFQDHRVHRLVVTHKGRVSGILSCRDLLGAIVEQTGYLGLL